MRLLITANQQTSKTLLALKREKGKWREREEKEKNKSRRRM
jgi:hypothetical protein